MRLYNGAAMTQVHTRTDIAANIAAVQERIAAAAVRAGRRPEEITLVAVAKTFPAELITEAHRAGVQHFGENWIQEAQEKIPAVGPGPTWHMVGHLQTNKVKAAVELFDVIQSVDSIKLGEAIARRKRMPVLLEVNVAGEATKQGLTPGEVPAAVNALKDLLDVRGLMTVAPETHDPEQVRPVFKRLRELAQSLDLPELSMGMSEDFEVAIEEGATFVRLGRAIFGQRPSK